MKKTELEEKVIYAMEQAANGDPLKDFLDDYEIIDALELLVEYIEAYYDE